MSLIQMVQAFFGMLWRSKLKILLTFVSAIVFSLFIFPFDDLSDLISAQVSNATNNTVFVQFEKLKMLFFPRVGVKLENVYVESVSFPGLQAEKITIKPTISSLISKKPYGSIQAEGILKGDLQLELGSGGTSDKGAELTHIELEAQKINLQDLRQVTQLPMLLKGQLDVKTGGKLDLTFQEQPDIEVNLKIKQLEMPPSNVPTAMGDMTLPEMKLNNVELKGRLNGGRFLIETGNIGAAGDDLQGTIKGSLGLQLRNMGTGVVPEFGVYSFDIDILPSSGFKDRAGFFLSLLSGYQSGTRYRLKVSGNGFYAPPNMAPLR